MSCVTSVVAVFAVLAMTSQATYPGLSHQEIAQAVADGARSGEEVPLEPYFLQRHVGRSRGPNVAIYTPYLRIALASRVARQHNKLLAPGDLPEWITSPNVLVVFRSPCPPGDCSYQSNKVHTYTRDMAPSAVYSGPHVPTGDKTRPLTSALAVVRDLTFLEIIGGQPFDDAVLAAMFPMEAIQPGTSLIARWDFGMDRIVSGGHITHADTLAWRHR